MYLELWNTFTKGYGRVRKMALIFLITVAVSLLEGFNVGLLVPLLETFQRQEGTGEHWLTRGFDSIFSKIGLSFSLETILISMAVLVAFQGMLKYIRMLLLARVRADFIVWLRSRAMDNLLHADLRYHHQERLGALTDTLTTQTQTAGGIVLAIAEMLSSLAIAMAYLVAAFLISPILAALALAVMAVVTLMVQRYISTANVLGTDLVQRNHDYLSAAVETLSGIRVIKSFVAERLRLLDFRNKAERVGDMYFRLDRNGAQLTVVQELALFGVVGGIVYLGVSVLSLDLAVIIALLFVLYRLTPRMSGLNSLRRGVASTMGALRRVNSIIEETSHPTIVGGEQQFTKLSNAIELKNVSFWYDDGVYVLKDTNFTIEVGKMTALVGTSGAGKSTMVDLMLRFYDPIQGSILVDGVDLKDLDLDSWRRSIGVVSQDIYLFNDTISNNIRLAQPEATLGEVTEAARQAYADDFIQQLPMGYDTVVGDHGWNISGGQRQRVALARAILRKPQTLILDEATSSLDSESEEVIQRYLQTIKGTCTIIVVAHRMSTIHNADKIAVLQDGVIVEEGDWESLLAEEGVFATYHQLQFGGQRTLAQD